VKLHLGQHGEAIQHRIEGLIASGVAEQLWERQPSLWSSDPGAQDSIANRLGWLGLSEQMQPHIAELEAFADDIRDAGFSSVVLLGMGGSSLAPEVLRQCVDARPGAPRMHVLDTTDPATIDAVTRSIDPARTLFFVSSKSGTTIEALTLFAYFHELVSRAKAERQGENFVAVTDEGTPLQDLAQEHGFRRVFTNPSDIGGRYSALSFFGLAPAAAAGIDVGRLLAGGATGEASAHERDSDALRLGAALGHLAREGIDKCTFITSPGVAAFGLWVEQLIAESTGKQGKGILPVAGEPIVPPRKYNRDRVFVELRLEGDSTGDADAAIGALVNEGFPAIVIDLEDAYDLGREFFDWEFAVAVAAHVIGINPFDEPNVQESKDNTSRVLKEAESGDGLPSLPPADAADISTFAGALTPGGYFAITAYIQQTAESDAAFARLRRAVLEECGVATTLGYGPRFLHSTGQYHKGGPQDGAFFQVIDDSVEDLAIPGRAFTFGQLKRGQMMGDRESLLGRGRPVLSVGIRSGTDDLGRFCAAIERRLRAVPVGGA
jgi:glucose-6-phosphate isomerase